MIIAEGKKLTDIQAMLEPFNKVLILGCGGCATVCAAGGAKEVSVVAAALRLARQVQGNPSEIWEETVLRQCQPELLGRTFTEALAKVDAVLALGCGVGVQSVAEQVAELYPDKPVFPGLNTKFMGTRLEPGVWTERCRGCGECSLHRTFGICSVTRCAKGLLNGPCDGAQSGTCEYSPELECAWHKIYERAKQLGQVASLGRIFPAKDWSPSGEGGSRKVVRGDLRIDESGE